MPLPRFTRLADERRAHILQTARRHIARDGARGASYNQIIADCGISKTSAYLYFDGKDDLVSEVVRECLRRVLGTVGPWPAAGTPAEFWAQLRDVAARLGELVVASPEDLAVLKDAHSNGALPLDGEDGLAGAWFDALLRNGVELGVVRDDVDHELLRAATIAVFRTIDAWALDAMTRKEIPDLEAGFRLVASMWTSQRKERA